VITVWIGDKVPSQEAGTILLYAALGFHLQAVTGPATTYAQATHRVGTTFWWFLLPQALLLAGLLGWHAYRGDLSVLNVAQAAMEARMASSVLVILHALSTLRISTWLFVKDVALIGMLPYAVGYAVAYAVAYRIDLLAIPRLDALLALTIIASSYLVVAIGLLLGLMSTREERQTLKSLALRVLPGRP
jgi:hypothetical protein